MDTKSEMRKRNNSQSAENPRGKKRKQREHAENKLARVPREEARQESKKPRTLYFEGPCTDQSCGWEQACNKLNDTHNYCLCTSDGRPAMSGNPCPRIALPPSNGNPIHGVRPPMRPSSAPIDKYASSPPSEQVAKSVTDKINAETTIRTDTRLLGASLNPSIGLSLLVFAGCVTLLIIIVPVVVWYFRRRICTLSGKTKPRVRPGEPLLAERYITNPQYGVYGSGPLPAPVDDTNEPQVPLLDRHALTFLEEVGEGCFGKVHKGLLRASSGEQVVHYKVNYNIMILLFLKLKAYLLAIHIYASLK